MDNNEPRVKKKKVAILGYVPHRSLAPFDDESFEIWGINDLFLSEDVKRWDRWFQIHHPVTIAQYCPSDGRLNSHAMFAEYAKWDCPVYMRDKHPDVPNSEVFPFEVLVKEFGTYFTSSASWMIAFAIHEGFEEIHVYGIDMSTHSEYGHQRPSCEYLLGIARGKGIKVHIPDESDLLKVKYLYALELERENVEKKNLEKRFEYLKQQYADAERREFEGREAKLQVQGAIVIMQELLKEIGG